MTLEKFQYRWGDSPVDSSGIFTWLRYDPDDQNWKEVQYLRNIPGERQKFLWLRTQLPDREWDQPTLTLSDVPFIFEAYIDTDLIYTNGELKSLPDNKYKLMQYHMFPLRARYAGRLLYLRIFSDNPGTIRDDELPAIGTQTGLFSHMLLRNIDSYVIGILLLLIGPFSIIIFLKGRDQHPLSVLAFGVFTLSVGLSQALTNPLNQYIFPHPKFIYHVGITSFILFPVGMWAFYEQIGGSGYRSMIRRFWQFHILFACITLLLDITNISPLLNYSILFLFLITLELLLSTIQFIASRTYSKSEKNSVKLFYIGFLTLAAFGMHDTLITLNVIPPWHYIFSWGTLIFVLFLAYIVELQFAESRRNLVTQQKLMMQEKMASLGDLVAGVAHEINNPIGAINSSADVFSKAVDKIDVILSDSGKQTLRESSEYSKKLITIIRENTQVIRSAGSRIAAIIQSLKNFARLDEAELKTVDLKEGIESTLALMQHELQNRIEVQKEYHRIPEITCYPNQLNQVFMSILDNAVNAIKNSGIIKVKLHTDGTNIFVEISDTGAGIPSEDMNKIFEPGFTTRGMGVGTGLGLSISYNILKKHRGEIQAVSTVGHGTTFTIILPVHTE